jgi:hypothetical protein
MKLTDEQLQGWVDTTRGGTGGVVGTTCEDFHAMAAELLAARSELAAQKETREYLKCAGAGVRRLRDELAAARTWCEVLQKAGMSAEESRDFALDERDALKLDNARLAADLAQTVEKLGEAREVADNLMAYVNDSYGGWESHASSRPQEAGRDGVLCDITPMIEELQSKLAERG